MLSYKTVIDTIPIIIMLVEHIHKWPLFSY